MHILKRQARSWNLSSDENMDSLSPPDHTKLHSEELRLKCGKAIVQRLVLISGNYKVAWVCDVDITNCMRCNRRFDLFTRKHHCRLCGYIVCAKCSEHRLAISLLDEPGGSKTCTECFRRRSLCDYAESTNVPCLPPAVLPDRDQQPHRSEEEEEEGAGSGSECSTLGRHTINTTFRDTLTESMPEIYYDPAAGSGHGSSSLQSAGVDFSEWTDRYSMHINTAHSEAARQGGAVGQSTVPRMGPAPPLSRSRAGSAAPPAVAVSAPGSAPAVAPGAAVSKPAAVAVAGHTGAASPPVAQGLDAAPVPVVATKTPAEAAAAPVDSAAVVESGALAAATEDAVAGAAEGEPEKEPEQASASVVAEEAGTQAVAAAAVEEEEGQKND
jgi:hypothetical protein